MITKNEIQKFIIDIIEDKFIDDTLQLDNETTFEDCNMDSLDTIELIIECENEYSIAIYDAEYDFDSKICDIIELINKKVNG